MMTQSAFSMPGGWITPTDRVHATESGSAPHHLTPTRVAPETSQGGPQRPAPESASWVVYTPDDKRQSLSTAFLDSLSDHAARYGPPTLVLLHPDNVSLLAGLAAPEWTVYLSGRGGITVQPGTWGLTHAE